MVRSLISVIIIACLQVAVFGQPVSQQEALSAAGSFIQERAELYYPGEKERQVIPTGARSQEFPENLYVFNLNPQGFIITTSDRSAVPVVGYSFEGGFSDETLPPALEMWLESYSLQIRHIDDAIDPTEIDRNREEWNRLIEGTRSTFSGRSVEPLLYSTWDQGKYYNQQCPADPAGPGGHCLTGCVATAMAQILHYFMWPDTGTGNYSYFCPPYDTLSADFGSSQYRFDLMEPYLISTNPEAAEILYHLGVSVDMVYGPESSGMYNHKAAYSMRTYFKYLPTTEYVYRDSTTMDWDSLIVAHLNQNIPMYYAGWSVPNLYGHAFVCDGYQDTGYYHFNWGWSGSYDGYFYTDNLTPGGSNFNLAQELIINAVPDTNAYIYPSGCNGMKTFNTLAGTIDDGSGPMYDYGPGLSCDWLIAPGDSVTDITLSFHRFDLDESDTLFIYEGADMSSPLLAALTGGVLPESLVSESDTLYLLFETDQSGQSPGFLATFSSGQPEYCTSMTTLTSQTDTITDGSGSYMYHDNTSCLWIIQPPEADHVTLYFTEFATEDTFDHVSIYDLETQELLAEYSGIYSTILPEPVTSPSGKMFIAFSTNYTQREQGWSAYYLTDLVSVDEPGRYDEVRIFPVPSTGEINVILPEKSGPVDITLSDLAGKTIIAMQNIDNPGNIKLNVGEIMSGVYIVRIGTGKDITSQKVIIQR